MENVIKCTKMYETKSYTYLFVFSNQILLREQWLSEQNPITLFKYHVQKKQQRTGEVKLLSHGSLLFYQANAQRRLQLCYLNCACGS